MSFSPWVIRSPSLRSAATFIASSTVRCWETSIVKILFALVVIMLTVMTVMFKVEITMLVTPTVNVLLILRKQWWLGSPGWGNRPAWCCKTSWHHDGDDGDDNDDGDDGDGDDDHRAEAIVLHDVARHLDIMMMVMVMVMMITGLRQSSCMM